MKKMKRDTKLIFRMDGTFAGGVDIRTWHIRKRWWTKARIPGEVRKSRMPGGSSYQGDKAWVTNGNSLQALADAYAG